MTTRFFYTLLLGTCLSLTACDEVKDGTLEENAENRNSADSEGEVVRDSGEREDDGQDEGDCEQTYKEAYEDCVEDSGDSDECEERAWAAYEECNEDDDREDDDREDDDREDGA